MQFLWKYIDEILGKGFTVLEMLELIMYYAITLIPLAVPITILIASVMVFGDMSEKFELSSMKSAGVSLIRIMAPGMAIALLIGVYSLLASNFFKPAANLQFQKRLISLRKQKSALAIEEGIFNYAFGETVMRIADVEDDGKTIHDVLIYDHNQNDKSLISMLSAKGGEMFTAQEGKFFIMELDTGIQYRELERKFKPGTSQSEIPFTRTYFDKWTKMFDMSVFDTDDGVLNFNRNSEDMMHTGQLLVAIDTFNTIINRNKNRIQTGIDQLFTGKYNNTIANVPPSYQPIINVQKPQPISQQTATVDQALPVNKDSLKVLKNKLVKKISKLPIPSIQERNLTKAEIQIPEEMAMVRLREDTIIKGRFADLVAVKRKMEVLGQGITNLTNSRDEIMTLKNINYDYNRQRQKHLLRLNQQYAWATVCLVFLFIGAPLGSIIRKGGYGYPLLFAILFYMIFIISTIFGEKLVKNESMGGIQAAWLPCFLLTPFAVVLTIMALRDIKFNFQGLLSWLPKRSK
jgi:lipopolysaccharide export system permease protein